ncbi:formate transporter FocA [Vibrio sp. UCD-FRSSP16_10]|uniref:formate transporter FocA n=1 Tax=unclassified Vibrio TaxID=2614977 RepID=UPI0007FDF9CD|nr:MULTISPECIES: formate transporter FocA [unclassified Vibrio]OBT17219.1 formate transporter FocA [Vibrio sp. UCD-FRSSP16_30]OBT22988.1 formate transporter FocA [Vibrio sp. UCD-FRSSP16_10]
MPIKRPSPELVDLGSSKAMPSLTMQAADYGHKKVLKPFKQSFGLSMFAGAFIALAFVFYITVTTGSAESGWGMTRFIGGLAFSLGLMLVVVCGGELFTSTVLSSIAWAQKRVTTKQLLGCWARVYLGNFAGAILTLAFIMMAKMHLLDHGNWGLNALSISTHKLEHSWWQAFSLGVMCNLLVCLGIWMSFSSKESASKAFFVLLPVAMFISSGFEHSVANMFMVPLGMAIKAAGDPMILSAASDAGIHLELLTIKQFITANLIPVTLGNIFGGAVLVGLAYWSIEPKQNATSSIYPIKNSDIHYSSLNSLEHAMLEKMKNLRVADLASDEQVTFSEELNCHSALKLLIDNNQAGAAVLGQDHQVKGFISQQDLLRALWGQDFDMNAAVQVKDYMQTPVCTLSPEQSILSALEPMIVDQDTLYPVNQGGFYMGGPALSFSERLAKAASKMPSAYPVVFNGQYVGLLNRDAIALWVANFNQPQMQKKKDLSVA